MRGQFDPPKHRERNRDNQKIRPQCVMFGAEEERVRYESGVAGVSEPQAAAALTLNPGNNHH